MGKNGEKGNLFAGGIVEEDPVVQGFGLALLLRPDVGGPVERGAGLDAALRGGGEGWALLGSEGAEVEEGSGAEPVGPDSEGRRRRRRCRCH